MRATTKIPKFVNALLVDDNDLCRNSTERLLKKYKNLSITTCTNGKDALEKYTTPGKRKYEVAFIDYQMPEMDGITLIKKIREHEKTTINLNPSKLICKTHI